MVKVGVVGAGGRMGQEVCRAVTDAPDLSLVAAVDPAYAGREVADLTIAGDIDALAEAGAEVVVDFSVAEAARANLPFYAGAGLSQPVWNAYRELAEQTCGERGRQRTAGQCQAAGKIQARGVQRCSVR